MPLERFELSFTTASPLKLKRDVCHGARQHVTGKLTGHNGEGHEPARAAEGRPAARPTVTLKSAADQGQARPRRRAIRTIKLGSKRVKTSQRVRLRVGKRYRVTVVDRAKETWRLTVRVRR